MKKKLIIFNMFICGIIMFGIITVTNFNLVTDHNLSLADLAIMANANGEATLPCECGDLQQYRCYAFENKCACLHDPEVQDPPPNCKNNIPANCDC